MTVNIQVPKLPDSVTDGTIVSWYVAEGDTVIKNQTLVEIETDKVVLEVVAPDDGVIISVIKDVDSLVESSEVIGQLKLTATKVNGQSSYNTDNLPEGFFMNNEHIILEIKDQNGYCTKKINISDLPISLGKDMHSDVYINGTYVSSSHGKIKLENNSLIYEDFSKNGTFVNGKAVHYMPNKSITINQDDEIILAGYYPNQQRDFPCITIKEIYIKDDELKDLRSQLQKRIFNIVSLLHHKNKNPILHVGIESYIESHTKTIQSAKQILSWSDEQLMTDAYSDGLLEYDITSNYSKPSHTPMAQQYVEPSFHTSHDDIKIIKDEKGNPVQLFENGQTYDLKKLGTGGTATVYQYQKNGDYKAVKIYNADLIAAHNHEYQEKLQTMLRTKPESAKTIVNGQEYTQFVWPETLVYDKNELVGYTMQALPQNNLYQLSAYIRNLKHLDKNHHSIFYRIQVARNLAIAVQNLHKVGHYFVDIKPENIFVFKDKCNVCFIDCDGFSIQQGKYPAQHYSKGYQAPFVLQNKLKPIHLSSEPYQDYYCLSHIIFQILDFGNGPFNGGVNKTELEDQLVDMDGDSTYDYKVEHGLYPYHLHNRDDITPFHKSTFKSWPIGLRKLFDLAFVGKKDTIPTPLDWAKELEIYIQNQDFRICQNEPNNPLHHHFKGMYCPICHLSGKKK